jgi:transcriptional regulator with XRE-family HTH domain
MNYRRRYGGDALPSLYVDIGERIMLARRRAGLSQRAFGERLGISHAAVSDLERGKTKPDLDNLFVIAEALGVPISEIVALSDRRPPGSAE